VRRHRKRGEQLGAEILPAPQRIFIESRGHLRDLRGATNGHVVEGPDCPRFGGSGSDLAEEPVARVQSRSRRLRVVPTCPPGPLLLDIEKELAIGGVAHVMLERAEGLPLGLPPATFRSK
jgi:hypothetical protein